MEHHSIGPSDATRVIKYNKNDAGPFRAIVSLKVQDKDRRPPLDMEVMKSLIKMGVNFSLLERTGRFKWSITFLNSSDANNAITNRFVQESNYLIEVPWYMVYRKVVIRGISTDVTNEEIWEKLKVSNTMLTFDKEDIFRLKVKSYVNGVANYVDSTSVRLSLRSSFIPASVFMWRTRMPLAPYIPSIRQCHNCGQMSHSTKFCKNNAKCLTCGLDSHNDGSVCSNVRNCINCGGNHPSLFRDCPEIIVKKKTTELMATQNMDYNSAKRIVTQGFPGTALRNSNGNGHPQPNNVEFPILTRHKNDAQPSPMHLPTSNYGGTDRKSVV